MVPRHINPILIRDGTNEFEQELGGVCTHDGFYMHQVPLVNMAVFRQASLEPMPSGVEGSSDLSTAIMFEYAELMYSVLKS